MKNRLAVALALLVCTITPRIGEVLANDDIQEAINSEWRVRTTVSLCKNDIYENATFDYFFENRTTLNFKVLRLAITAFDKHGQILDRTTFDARGLRPNITRTGQIWLPDAECGEIQSVLIEDDYIFLWDSKYSNQEKEQARLVELVEFNWLDSSSVKTTFISANTNENKITDVKDAHKTEVDINLDSNSLQPLGSARYYGDVGACGSEYHVSGGIGTLAFDHEIILLGFSHSKMTIDELSNLPFDRTGGTVVNIDGDYIEFFQNSSPHISRVLQVSDNNLGSAKGEFVTFETSNLLFASDSATRKKPECENMSYEESVKLHEHCYVIDERITLLTVLRNGNISSKAIRSYCAND